MDDNQDVRRAPNVTLRWVLRGLCIVAGAGIAWMLAASVSHASPITDLTDTVSQSVSSQSSSSSRSSSPVAKQIAQTKKQLTQTTKKVTKTTGSVVNTTTSKVQKTVAPVLPKPVNNSIDKVVKVVNHSIGHTTDTVTKIVDKPASTIVGVVTPTPTPTPAHSTPQVPTGNLTPHQGPAPHVFTPEALTLSVPLTADSNDTLSFINQPVTDTNSGPAPIASDHQYELQMSFRNAVATITNSVNLSTAGIAGILPLSLAVLLGFFYLGMFRELRGGVVKRPYLVPVTPD